MKKIFFYFLFLSLTLTMNGFGQASFYTGAIGINQSNGGRTRIFSDNQTTRQISRLTLLVGVSSTAVFDYDQDQDVSIPAATVGSPLSSDFEITSTINNSFSNLSPNVEASLNIYGWNNGAYLLVKTTVKNNEAAAINAVIGLEAMPQISNTYTGDTLEWNSSAQTLLMYDNVAAGIKFLSSTQKSLKVVDWLTIPHANDSLYYAWLTQNSFESPFIANSAGDGAAAHLGQDPVNIGAGDSAVFYYGISIGSDQATCLSNMDLCEAKYNQVIPVELTSFAASVVGKNVTLNWLTATEINNRGFEVQRKAQTGNFETIVFVEGNGTTQQPQAYNYTDKNLENGKYSYRLKQVDLSGSYSYSNIAEVEVKVPAKFGLNQNYPNPFNPTTTISYEVAKETNVSLKVYDIIGNEIATLVNEAKPAGTYQVIFDASNLSNGVYLYKIQAGNFSATKKLILMK
jgi:hypothetical protein